MTQRETILTGSAPRPIGPYSQAIASGSLVFCSGQVALDPASGELQGGGDAATQARVALANLCAVLDAAGCSPADVVKTTLYLTDMADFAAVNAVYAETFGASGEAAPARSTVAVAGLPKGARIEVDAIAVRPAPGRR